MQTTTNPDTNIPTPILIAIGTLLLPCAVPALILLAGPPEWFEFTWHVLHIYTALLLSLLGVLYGVQLWNAKSIGKSKSISHRRSTMLLSLSPALVACVSLIMPAVMGVGALLLGFVGFKTALARQEEVPARVPQWYGQLADQFAAWVMIFLGIALGTILL